VFDRMRDALTGKKGDEEPVEIRVTETPADLRRGDVIVFGDAGDAVVNVVLDCRQSLSGRQSTWRWLKLSSGAWLEVIGPHTFIYPESEVLERDTVAFQRLTGTAEEPGVLQIYEERVREGAIATDPVMFRMDNVAYRLESTGTFLCTRTGALSDDVWRDISEEESQNVYFRMHGSDDSRVLGIWTAEIVLLKGRPLESVEIKALYGA
jgi:hypothetical protein